MTILSFLLALRLKNLLKANSASTLLSSLTHLLFLIIAISYGTGIGYLFNFLENNEYRSFDELLQALNVFLFLFVLISGFFPHYAPLKLLFLRPHPIASFKKALLQLIFYLLSPFHLYLFLFLICFYCTLKENNNLVSFLVSTLIVAVAFVLKQGLKLPLQKVFRSASFIIAALVTGTVYLLNKSNLDWSIKAYYLLPCLLASILSFINLYGRLDKSENSTIISGEEKNNTNLTSIIFKKNTTRKVFVTAVLFKVIFCILILIAYFQKKQPQGLAHFIFPVICTPAIYFTYIFNNFFGFHPQLFSFAGYRNMQVAALKLYARSLVSILLLDAIISTTLLVVNYPQIDTIVFLIIASIDCFLLGFMFSIMVPKKVNKAFDLRNMSGNTHLLSNLVTISTVFSLFQFRGNYFILFGIEVLVIAAFYMFYSSYFQKNGLSTYRSVMAKIF